MNENVFFSTERQLRFFRTYTQYNCEAECLANFTQIQCGCVKFSMPSRFLMAFSRWSPKNVGHFMKEPFYMNLQEEQKHEFVVHPKLNAIREPKKNFSAKMLSMD